MSSKITTKSQHTEDEKTKAAYALNLCTVSVSQIVDYNDAYILEQEYDAILNNLNLKEMPKDEALLKIISELLNTITFFRIQKIKKDQIDKKYRQRLKNAIWSAIPNLSVIVSGDPVTIAISLATQIGTGYMNYRKEKANAASDRDDDEIELQITAIEQINALKRELFTTAWRLADEYGFDDELRLTEKQITQYNAILQDDDEYRKYARLEAIANRFKAYPPFWYFYGHTANFIAQRARNEMNMNPRLTHGDMSEYSKAADVEESYKKKAKEHFKHYYSLCKNNLLREDSLTASFALEYVDLLWNEEQRDVERIKELLKMAETMGVNSFDVLQLCAVSYLKIGASEDAARLLKILVNEDYNATANAKLLSKLYVSKYIETKDEEYFSEYKILERQIDPLYLFPIPDNLADGVNKQVLESNFWSTQKEILKKAYRNTINAYSKKYAVEFNAVLPSAKTDNCELDFYNGYDNAAKERRINDVKKAFDNKQSREDYLIDLKKTGFRQGYVYVLNRTVSGLEKLSCFKMLKSHDDLIKMIEARLRMSKKQFVEIQERLDSGEFSYNDYLKLVNNYSYHYFTENFFEALKKRITDNIDVIEDMRELDTYDFELSDFCKNNGLPSPEEYLHIYKKNDDRSVSVSEPVFFGGGLLGLVDDSSDYSPEKVESMLALFKQNIDGLVQKPENISLHFMGDNQFDAYLKNSKFKEQADSFYSRKQKAFAILDDKTKKDFDLIFCVDGVTLVAKNTIRNTVKYENITYTAYKKKNVLELDCIGEYTNKAVDIAILKGIVDKLKVHSHN